MNSNETQPRVSIARAAVAMDEEDLFELQYGDELDALQDLEDEDYHGQLSRP